MAAKSPMCPGLMIFPLDRVGDIATDRHVLLAKLPRDFGDRRSPRLSRRIESRAGIWHAISLICSSTGDRVERSVWRAKMAEFADIPADGRPRRLPRRIADNAAGNLNRHMAADWDSRPGWRIGRPRFRTPVRVFLRPPGGPAMRTNRGYGIAIRRAISDHPRGPDIILNYADS